MKHPYYETASRAWDRTSGQSDLEKAINLLNSYTQGGSYAWQVLKLHPARCCTAYVDERINRYIKQKITTLEQLVAELKTMPGIEKGKYLDGLIQFLDLLEPSPEKANEQRLQK